MIVRANAVIRYGPNNQRYQVDDPEFYQKNFFEPVSKALFLTALQVEDRDIPAAEKAEEAVRSAEETSRLEEERRKKKAAEKPKKPEGSTTSQ